MVADSDARPGPGNPSGLPVSRNLPALLSAFSAGKPEQWQPRAAGLRPVSGRARASSVLVTDVAVPQAQAGRRSRWLASVRAVSDLSPPSAGARAARRRPLLGVTRLGWHWPAAAPVPLRVADAGVPSPPGQAPRRADRRRIMIAGTATAATTPGHHDDVHRRACSAPARRPGPRTASGPESRVTSHSHGEPDGRPQADSD